MYNVLLLVHEPAPQLSTFLHTCCVSDVSDNNNYISNGLKIAKKKVISFLRKVINKVLALSVLNIFINDPQ